MPNTIEDNSRPHSLENRQDQEKNKFILTGRHVETLTKSKIIFLAQNKKSLVNLFEKTLWINLIGAMNLTTHNIADFQIESNASHKFLL